MASSNVIPLIERGVALMREREWHQAMEAFTEAVRTDERTIDAWEGVARCAMCVDDFDTGRAALERAFAEAQRVGDWRSASRAAMHLGVFYVMFRAEAAIASGWFGRARRLLADHEPVAEHAWLALYEAHVLIHLDGSIAEGSAKLEEAVRLKDLCGAGPGFDLLTGGLGALLTIGEGRVQDGLRRLDEITATVLTDLPTPQLVGWTCCYVLDACERVRDFDRAVQWLERGLDAGRRLAIAHFDPFCRQHYLSVLIWRGEYEAAEREMNAIRVDLEKTAPAYATQLEIWIGEIRRRQGNLDAADAVLAPHASWPSAMLSLAWLALDRGRAQDAVDLAERYLRRTPSDRLRRVHGLDPLVRAQVQLGRLDQARGGIDELRRLADGAGAPLMTALAHDVAGVAAAARGDLEEARHRLEDAVDGYDINGAPYEATVARLALGAVLQRLGRGETMQAVLAFAKRTAEGLGAGRLLTRADRALADTGAAPRASSDLTSRELEVLALVAEGVSNQEIGDRLCISAFTVKRHIANILTKLDQPSRAAAAAYAIRAGLL